MKMLRLLVVFGLSFVLPGQAANPSTNAVPQLRLDLTDGSRLIGTTDLANLPLHSESVGNLTIPLSRLAVIKFRPDHKPASITLANGDRLEGTVALPKFTLSTVFGKVQVPLEHVREIQVGHEAAGHALQLKAAHRNYLEIPASDDFDVTANWTLEFWANITGGKGENITPILRGGDDCGQEAAIQFDVNRLNAPNAFFYAIDANGGGAGVTGPKNLMDGKWHHWAGVVRDQQIRLYIDGVRVATQPYTAGATGSRCPLRIGYRATHGGCFIDATFDEIRLSRVARYDRDFPLVNSFPLDGDTIAYWRFNEGSGTTARDETGKHDGVLHGDPPPQWVEGITLPSR